MSAWGGSSGSEGNKVMPSNLFHSDFGANRFGPIKNAVPRSLLKYENRGSAITAEDLNEIRSAYDIPPYVRLAAPSSLERPDWIYPGWTIMYEYFFTIGARIPLPRLVLEASSYFRISPSQLMPNVWRILMAIQVFSELRKVHFSIYDVLLAYSLEKHKTESIRYQFRTLSPLILSAKDSERDWKSKYFIIPFDALGAPGSSDVQESWQNCVCLKRKPPVSSKRGFEKIDWFLSFGEEERHFSAILTSANLQSSSLWNQPSACSAMSKSFFPSLSKGNAMENFRQRNKRAFVGSDNERVDEIVNMPPPSPIQTRRRDKQVAQIDLTDSGGTATDLSFPSFLAAHPEYPKFRDEAEKLFLKDNSLLECKGSRAVVAALFDDMLLQLQKTIFLKEQITQMATELTDLKDEMARCQTEMGIMRRDYDEARGVIQNLEAAKEESVRHAAAECRALREEVKELKKQMVDVSCDTEIITRGLIAGEFQKVKPSQMWDVSRYVAEFEEWKKENPEWVAEFERQCAGGNGQVATNFVDAGFEVFRSGDSVAGK